MKYLYHSLVLMLALVVSCEKQRVNPEFSKRTDIIIRQNVPGYVMSKDEVAEYASKLACVFNETKAAIKAVKSISPVTDVWKFDMEDSLSQDERSLLSVIYVVNYENNGGFAIIPGTVIIPMIVT